MSSFSASSLEKKLDDLTSSQQSVQTLSLWLIHHRKHAKAAVEVWCKQIEKAHSSRLLTFLYLANDVLQNSKKKGQEFNKEFAVVLPDVLKLIFRVADDHMMKSLDRILTIWNERNVFGQSFIDELKAISDGEDVVVEPKKKRRKESETTTTAPIVPAPESDKLLQLLKELETAASTDDAMRMQIASLPEDVQDVSFVDSIQTQVDAEILFKRVQEASSLLHTYNARLDAEQQQRQKVIDLLQAFIAAQQTEHERVTATLEDHRQRLNRVVQVHQQLRNHLANLPDITQLPQYASGLAPLPSAHDLFS